MVTTAGRKISAYQEDLSNFIPYCQHSIDEDEIQEVVDTLRSDWLTSGPRTLKFEQEFADFIGCRYAVAVSSCTAGLHLALNVCGIGPNDEVITTPFTFCATAEVIEYQRARPVFVDIDPETFNIDPTLIEEKITACTKAILPVHYGGIPCDLQSLYGLAERHGLAVIEDAAHAVGSIDAHRKIGSSGHPTVFSFYPTKNMTTVEGGVITTNDEQMAERLRVLSLHGISKDAWKRYSNQGRWYYEIHHLGYKYNFTDLQAALGTRQLKKLDYFNAVREEHAWFYFEAFRNIPGLEMPGWYYHYFDKLRNNGFKNSWHLFVLMLDLSKLRIHRDRFIVELKSRGIGTSVHFIPLHVQPYYAKKYGYHKGDFPAAETVYSKIISLPLYPRLTREAVTRIVDAVQEVTEHFRF
ncbi:MAG: aminotransferase class I/II-fold pyridoxal phosphate-dependent enzyme [Aliifodinibius sp.]|nr:DegT/DnrJ/EryC1/StrS family aminotransferase [Fodinibius sp.]NIY27708.1 aminotransferase class I/II-fold pyridoxal phosphate-dependent enzyme [Fodinibius sp.]